MFHLFMRDMCLFYQHGVMAFALRKAVFVKCFDERIGIQLLDGVNAGSVPFARKEHKRAAHSGNTCGVAYGLALYLTVAFLVIANVVDVVSLVLAVFFAREDAADVGLSVGTGTEACWIGKESLKEF